MRKVPYGYWTKERISEEALKYKSRKDFEKAFPSAYRQAMKLKIGKTAFKHMPYVKQKAW